MSRLEEIKKDKALSNDDAVIKNSHYEWLIQQAERVEELEHTIEIGIHVGNSLQAQNQRYKQALEAVKSELEAHYRLGGTSDNGALEIIDRTLERDSDG